MPNRRTRRTGCELAAALAAVLVVGGCGNADRHAAPPAPRLPSTLAAQLTSQSDQVAERLAASDGCGALAAARQLRSEALAAIHAGRVPARFQKSLAAAANDLPLRIHCAPRAAPATPAEQTEHKTDKHGRGAHGHGHDHGHGHGNGKHDRK
jgi:hypothetical protein